MSTETASPAAPDAADWKWLLVTLFAVVLGAKLVLIHLYGNVTPYWDQWDAEAARLYQPYLAGTLDWAQMLAHHNEHRIFFTRLLGLVLLEAAGEWNPMLELVVNAVLHTAFIVLLAGLIGNLLAPAERFLLVALMAGLFVLPIGWENLLAGFQSQFYFVLIFSLLALFLMTPAPAFSPRWLGGLVFAVAAYFSFASGAFTPLAMAAMAAVQIVLRARRASFSEWLAVAMLLVVAAIMMVSVPNLPGHAPLKAHSLQQFADALLRIASAPIPMVGLLLHLPLVFFAVRVLRHPDRATPRHWLLLALAGWIAMQMVSIAYGRAIGTTESRYLDLMIVLLPLDFVALRSIAPPGRPPAAFASAWLLVLGVGLAVMTSLHFFPDAAERGRIGRAEQANVAAYLATGEIATLQNKPQYAVPYPVPQRLADLLSDPTIRAIMPGELRPLDADVAGLDARLVTHGRLAWWTLHAWHGAQRYGGILLGLGLALFCVVALRRSQREEQYIA